MAIAERQLTTSSSSCTCICLPSGYGSGDTVLWQWCLRHKIITT